MITYAQALLLGLLQGIAELFPISSLGHSVLVPALLHWNIDEHAPYFLTFLVATHFATALVLLAFFAKDWLKIIQGFFRSLLNRGIPVGDTYARLSWVIIVATVPAGIIGLLFQSKIQALLAAPTIVALFLVLNGALLYTIEEVQKGRARFFTAMTSGDVAIARLPWPYAAVTGLAQAIALLPGFSRTGASLGGGYSSGSIMKAPLVFHSCWQRPSSLLPLF
jgi:undecaprenyl-diphosphatase